MEILRDSIETFYNFRKGSNGVKIFALVLYAAFIYAVYRIFVAIGIDVRIGMVIILVLYVILCELALRSNLHFTDHNMQVQDAYRHAKHGDLVLFRSYENYDFPELLFYRHMNALTSKTFFGHIGIVLVLDGQKYVFESTEDEYFSDLTGTMKNGVLLQKFATRVQEYHGRVHIIPSNLGTYLNDRKRIWDFIHDMKTVPFVTWRGGISCMFIIRNLLNLFGLLKNPKAFPWRPEFFLDKRNYTVPVEFQTPYFILNDYVESTL